ncbi:hypothetical protein BGW80DRAFT_221525 [Lactifluus volemus]|nr:hypothetical protein BGW80DRAFT_221525 [Lactifluus volemus]
MPHLRPIISAYGDSSYDGMKNAIFPSYFHGKCQRNGVDPPGCPNPDCAVVCGTPGSLVHFFPTLRLISFNYTRHQLQELCSPGHDAYAQAERAVIEAAAGASHGRRDEQRRAPWFVSGATLAPRRKFLYVWKREESVKEVFRTIMRQIPAILERRVVVIPRRTRMHCLIAAGKQ